MINKLDKIAKKYSADKGFEEIITKYKIKEILKFTKGEKVLDLGCGNGLITVELAGKHKYVVGLDGSSSKLKQAKKNITTSNVKLVKSLFEDYKPKEKFDVVVIANVLEHVEHPVKLLKKIYKWLNRGGRVIATVPNAKALHKKIGLQMNIISNLYELTDEDIAKGHKRIYDMDSLIRDVRSSSFSIYYIGGILLKPFSHSLMEKVFNHKLIEALYKLREEFPDLCSSIIIVGEKK